MNIKQCIYKITLQPLDHFFFGGESLFDLNDKVFYFQSSRDFPQQTSLLGMLRYQILCQNELMTPLANGKLGIKSDAEAQQWIGASSFNGGQQDFGKIDQISPVFIQDKNGNKFFRMPKAKTLDKDTYKPLMPIDLSTQFIPGKVSFKTDSEEKKQVFHLNNYNAKLGLEYGFWNETTNSYHDYKSVFNLKETEQIGIYKKTSRTTNEELGDDEGFFKHKYSRLQSDFSFSFYVLLAEANLLSNSKVILGKEQSVFQMTVEESDYDFKNPVCESENQILLLSDSLVSSEIYDYCKGAISKTIPFRNLQFKISDSTEKYDDDPKKKELSKYNLLEKGTILYIKDDAVSAEAVYELLNKEEAFQSIGYNYYKILKSK